MDRRLRGTSANATSRLADRLAAWAIWALMLAGVVREMLGQTELVGFGFYTLHVVDPAVLLTFLAWAVYQLDRAPRGGPVTIPALLIALLLLVNFGRGLATDSAAALLWARGNVELAALLLLGLTCSVGPRLQSAFRRALVTAALLIAGLAVLRAIFGTSLFMTTSNVELANGVNDSNRAIGMSGAFIMSMAAVLLSSELLREGFKRSGVKACIAAVLLVAAITTRQGTVTIAFMIMLFAVVVLERGRLHGVRVTTAFFCLVALVIILAAGAFVSELAGPGSLDVQQRTSNLETRQNIWAGLMDVFPKLPLADQLFGLPGGQMPEIIVTAWRDPTVWRASIHSMYYGALPMMGYVGLVAYVTLLLLIAAGSLRHSRRREVSATIPVYAFAFTLGTAILSISYELRNEAVIGLFVAIWWIRAARHPHRLRLTSRFATQRRRSMRR